MDRISNIRAWLPGLLWIAILWGGPQAASAAAIDLQVNAVVPTSDQYALTLINNSEVSASQTEITVGQTLVVRGAIKDYRQTLLRAAVIIERRNPQGNVSREMAEGAPDGSFQWLFTPNPLSDVGCQTLSVIDVAVTPNVTVKTLDFCVVNRTLRADEPRTVTVQLGTFSVTSLSSVGAGDIQPVRSGMVWSTIDSGNVSQVEGKISRVFGHRLRTRAGP